MLKSSSHRQVFCELFLALTFFGTSWATSTFSVLYTFPGGTDGATPQSALVEDSLNNLYGTTSNGGVYGFGTIYEISSTGDETILHSFQGGADGSYPAGGMIFDKNGNLYGATTYGGGAGCVPNGCGTVFELSPSPNGIWTETVLYAFKGITDGASPNSPLIFSKSGVLYGTTSSGGASEMYGTVFALSPRVGEGWKERILYSFDGTDGANPNAGIILDSLGALYGTTQYGGLYGGGTVFKIARSNGGWTHSVLRYFTGGNDGAQLSGLVFDSKGVLYGTAIGGGGRKVGTVFQLLPAKGNWTLHIIHTFTGGNDGAFPYGQLVASGNCLYGTTYEGGRYQAGTVFRMNRGRNDRFEEVVLYAFMDAADGGQPIAGVLRSKQGNIFGTAQTGGTGCNGIGCGTVFEIAP
jgi:uncharacterized repeat protein (TIGR03803 family)